MLNEQLDLLSDEVLKQADAVCFTSNGVVKSNGAAVMGAGIARSFRDRFPGIDRTLGSLIKRYRLQTQICHFLPDYNTFIIALPTKNDWQDRSPLELIIRSAEELVVLADFFNWQRIFLPRPGCANGGLSWIHVREVLYLRLDDRFTVCYL